jgi:D-aspartate ligase
MADAEARLRGSTPPVLLTVADYYGTLAAVRSLGRAGVPVCVADWRFLAPARWSRYAARTMRCPNVGAEPERFLEWLLDAGLQRPGQVLLATSDDIAWILALHQEVLAPRYRLDVPGADGMYALLNKRVLAQTARSAGLDTPETWVPETDAELARIARGARFPLIIKPQTQALLSSGSKGLVVRERAALAEDYRKFASQVRHARSLLEFDPSVSLPLVQEYVSSAGGVYSLSGFVDGSAGIFVCEGAHKVLQRPLHAGVGLCFEEAEVVPTLASRLAAVCERVGYHGVFEAEFVTSGDRYLLIDFNPRFFGQIGFDVARGVDLPLLTYLAAAGDTHALRGVADEARRAARSTGRRVYRNALQLGMFVGMLRLAGRADGCTVRRWVRWVVESRGRATDVVMSRDDWAPAVADLISSVVHQVKHPRSAWRAVRNG